MNKKLVTAVLVPLMLMLVAGFGYANWTDSVAVNVAATTGDVEFRILAFGVCSQSGELAISAEGVGTYPYESINVVMSNTYPGSWAYFCLKVKNTGTISVELYRMRIVYVSGEAGWMPWYRFGIPDGNTWCNIGGTVYFENDLNWWSTWRYYTVGGELAAIPDFTIAPGAEYVLGGYFELDTGAPQVEGSTINVRLDLEVIQALP